MAVLILACTFEDSRKSWKNSGKFEIFTGWAKIPWASFHPKLPRRWYGDSGIFGILKVSDFSRTHYTI